MAKKQRQNKWFLPNKVASPFQLFSQVMLQPFTIKRKHLQCWLINWTMLPARLLFA